MKLKIIAGLLFVSFIGAGSGVWLGSEYRIRNQESLENSVKIALHEKFIKEAKYTSFAWQETNPDFNSEKLEKYNQEFANQLEKTIKADKEILDSYPSEVGTNNPIYVTSKKIVESMAKRSLFLNCAINQKVLDINYSEVVKFKNVFLESDKIKSQNATEKDNLAQSQYIEYLTKTTKDLENITTCSTTYNVKVEDVDILNTIKKYKNYSELGTKFLGTADEDTDQEQIDKIYLELTSLGNNYKLDEGKVVRDYILKILENIDKSVVL
jgi:hypothetical protein